MDSLPVTLIVKAPNQQIEDQKIRCETSWSINKLKQHLSEVYPSKPPQHEQKLIYSGQLLNDSLILKDVLRQYEGQDTHTVHLVCTPRLSKMSSRPKPATGTQNGSSVDRNADSTSSNLNGLNASATGFSPEGATPQSNEMDNRVPGVSNTGVPENGFPWANYNGQTPHMPFNNMNQYQMHMAMMQQAYLQYMAQYMQMASGQAPYTTPQTYTNLRTNGPVDPPNGQQNQPPVPQAAAQQNGAAQGQENEERDWLDVFYMLSRAMVLFSVVYFYSSPMRFIFVLFLGITLYLHQAGFFRSININNNNINGTPEGVPQEEQAPSRFMVAWTFITTFFASLIPEIPNINA